MALSNAERQAPSRAKRDAEIERLRKAAGKAAPASQELAEARKEIERLRQRLDEIEPFLADVMFWMGEADRIVKSRKGIMTHAAWANLIRCLHPDTRTNMSAKQLDEAFRLIEQRKLVLCDEQQMPTPKRAKSRRSIGRPGGDGYRNCARPNVTRNVTRGLSRNERCALRNAVPSPKRISGARPRLSVGGWR